MLSKTLLKADVFTTWKNMLQRSLSSTYEMYDQIQSLGNGRFGTIWLVNSKLDSQLYVMKQVPLQSSQTKERHAVINEIRILSTLKHRNIIQYKDALLHERNICILMEYADDRDLSYKIENQNGKLFLEFQIIDWFVQILIAVKYIHSLNIVHRDLKSENVFLTKDGYVKIGDFGISNILMMGQESEPLGTPYYMSPEMCQLKQYNNKSDMWSAGVILYELVTLRYPFIGKDLSELFSQIIKGSYAPISSCYGSLLKDFVSALLKVNADLRPSAAQLLNVPALQTHLSSYLMKVKHKDNPVLFKYPMEQDETLLVGLGRSTDSKSLSNLSDSSCDSTVSVKDAVANWERAAQLNNRESNRSSFSSSSHSVNGDINDEVISKPKEQYSKKKCEKIDFIQRNKVLAKYPPQQYKKGLILPRSEIDLLSTTYTKPTIQRSKTAPSPSQFSNGMIKLRDTATERKNGFTRTQSASKIPILVSKLRRQPTLGILDRSGTSTSSGKSTNTQFDIPNIRKRSRGPFCSDKSDLKNNASHREVHSHGKNRKLSTLICNESAVADGDKSDVITNPNVIQGSCDKAKKDKQIQKDKSRVKYLTGQFEEAMYRQNSDVVADSNGNSKWKEATYNIQNGIPRMNINGEIDKEMGRERISRLPRHSTVKEGSSISSCSELTECFDEPFNPYLDSDADPAAHIDDNNNEQEKDLSDSGKLTNGGHPHVEFNTPTKVSSAMMRSLLGGVIKPDVLERALGFVRKVNITDEELKNLWHATEILGLEHRWLLFNLIEIVQGERK